MVEFMKIEIWMHQIYHLESNNCRKTKMLWHGRPNGCGSWLPKDKKIIISGMEGKEVVANSQRRLKCGKTGRSPPPGNGGGRPYPWIKNRLKKNSRFENFLPGRDTKFLRASHAKFNLFLAPLPWKISYAFLPPLALLVPTITNIIKNRSTLVRKHSPS